MLRVKYINCTQSNVRNLHNNLVIKKASQKTKTEG